MKKNLLNIFILFFDIVLLIGIFYLTVFLRSGTNTSQLDEFAFVVFIIVALMYFENIYTLQYDFWQETKKILKSLVLAYIIVLALFTLTKTSLGYSQLFIGSYFLLAVFILPIAKRIEKRVIYKLSFFKKKVLVIGDNKQTEILKKELHDNWYIGMQCDEQEYDAVIITSRGMSVDEVNKKITKYLEDKTRVYIVPYVTNINFSNANIMEYSNIRYSTIQVENKLLLKINIWIKNFFDLLITLSIMPLFLPVHLLTSMAIKLDSKGDVFFQQLRLGKDNNDFICYKYRTMYEDADDILQQYLKNNPDEVKYYEKYHKYKNDPRITKVGRFLRITSLDELPQIINVLKGEMSLIGPRPYMLDESEQLGDDKNFILKVKPGITGLWQVSGRNDLTFKERNELEVWYIKNWSLWADFVILIKTLKVVFLKIGAK